MLYIYNYFIYLPTFHNIPVTEEILSCQERCLLQYKEKLERESNSQDKKHLVLELEKTKQKLEKVLDEQKEEKLKFDKEKEKLQNEKKKLESGRFNDHSTFIIK